MRRYLLQAVLGLLWLGWTITGTVAVAQSYPRQTSKTPEALKAGIGSYEITREGERAAVEAFDPEGALLADCEIEWQESSTAMTCTLSAGQRFRTVWHPQEDKVEISDLLTEERITLSYEGGPPRGWIELKPGEPPPPRGHWVVRGSKTWEEVERDWGKITPIFGALLGELEITLGILAERLARIGAEGPPPK